MKDDEKDLIAKYCEMPTQEKIRKHIEENMKCQEDPQPGDHGSTESSFQRIARHRRELDNVLVSIRGYTEESKLVRSFIVGQIEALDVAMKFFEV